MKRFIYILTLFLLLINPVFAEVTKQELSVQAADGFNINAVLTYPKDKTIKEYKTVVLLHSMGYSSEWWETLPEELLEDGYAVLRIDLRGHGKSVYNSKLVRTSWTNLTTKAFAKYPDDVIKVIEHIKTENSKKTFFENWALVGSDIGASTAVLVAEKSKTPPKTIVMLSPGIDIKGLYIPVKIAHLDHIDIFSISGKNDLTGQNAEKYLKKFAQAGFVTYTSEANSNGMHMLKNDADLSKIIAAWIKQYL